MLPFKVLKEDIKTYIFDWFETDVLYNGYEVTIIQDGDKQELFFHVENDTHIGIFTLPYKEFMQMSYKEYSKWFKMNCYYKLLPMV